MLSVGVVCFVFMFSVLTFGGGMRSLYALFSLVFVLGVSGFSFITQIRVLLFLMVYISGLGVIFVYLSRVDLSSLVKFSWITGSLSMVF